MLCILPVYKNDCSQLSNLILWITQLGGCRDHDASIVADAGTPAGQALNLQAEASRAFRSVELVTTDQSVNGWPEGPNALFLRGALHAQERGVPWLFLEPDATPITPKWLDQIEIHYQARKARYLGCLVPCKTPGLPKSHFTGVGVYPPTAYSELSGMIQAKPKIAFDLSTAEYLVPIATHSDLFQHLWGQFDDPPKFADKGIPGTSTFSLNYLKPKSVLFHRCKDGSLIDMLRRRLGARNPSSYKYPFIQLGRFGDIILLLPALKYIADTSGNRPKLICSTDYASVLDGVSYVEPIPLRLNWHDGMGIARQYAREHFGDGIVLQCYGAGWILNFGATENYMASMIQRTGVPLSMFHHLPLVFDRRSPEREQTYIPKTNGKPYVLINTAGISSPFRHGPDLIAALQRVRHKFELVDIGKLRCERIYDLLGVMDHAVGTITTDTSTLHLAHGSDRPYIALTVDGWCSSTPRGKCVLEVKYSRFREFLPRIVKTVEAWV